LKEAGKVIKPGQRVRFLFTLGEPGVYAWDLPARPVYKTIHVQRYRELLLRAAEEVLLPFDDNNDLFWKQNPPLQRLLPTGSEDLRLLELPAL
jgi:hypothetical protein